MKNRKNKDDQDHGDHQRKIFLLKICKRFRFIKGNTLSDLTVAFRNVSEKSDQKQGKDHTCDENDSSIAERLVCIAASFHKSAINDPTSAGHKVGTR